MLDRLWRGLTENRVDTNPAHTDPRLRGRTYAIPFDRVWRACTELAGGGLRRWWIARADDQRGVIDARQKTLVFRSIDDVRITVTLDNNGQTRVDVTSRSRKGRGDLGTNARRVYRFFRALDRTLEATPEQILDPTRTLRWTATARSVGLLLLSASMLLPAACVSSGPPIPGQPLGARDASDRFAVFWESYERDLVEGDPARLATWFTSDAELMEPETETLRGRNEIRGHLERMLATFRVTEVEITPREVTVYGDRAYDMGTAVETVEERATGGETTSWRSRYVAVWTLSSDGRWRIHRLLLSPLAGPSP